MRVWLTRTEPGASRDAVALSRHGFDVFKASVVGIEPLRVPLPTGTFDLAVFVSEHAVRCAVANGWHGHPCIAIGNAAATALRDRDVEPSWPTEANIRGVVNAIASALPMRTLLVKGAGGTDMLQRWLRSRGREVVEWDVYRRLPLRPTLDGERIDAILAASGDGLRAIGQLWFADGRDAGVPLLVPSARVADVASTLGFDNVAVTPGAGSAAVVDALLKLRTEGRDG